MTARAPRWSVLHTTRALKTEPCAGAHDNAADDCELPDLEHPTWGYRR